MATTKKTTAKKAPIKRAPKAAAVAVGEAQIYGVDGKSVGSIKLPENLFSAAWRPDLVHQVVVALAANKRQNRAHTKDRAEVSGGGRKPWKQKGTGQARHGSTRSPLWRHGGVTFGPRTERDYHQKINRRMKSEALLSALSRKAKDGEVILVEKFSFGAPKTKEAIAILSALGKASRTKLMSERGNAALIALANHDANTVKSFRNIGSVATEEMRNINPLQLLSYKYLVIERPKESFEVLARRV